MNSSYPSNLAQALCEGWPLPANYICRDRPPSLEEILKPATSPEEVDHPQRDRRHH